MSHAKIEKPRVNIRDQYMDFQKHVVVVMSTIVVVVVVVVCFIPPPTSSRFRLHIKQDLPEFRIFKSYLLLAPVSRLNLSNIAVKWVAVLIRILFMVRVHIWTERLLVLIPKANGFSLDKCRANTQIKPRPIPSTTSPTNY